jgi:hypothetical protein
MLLWRAGLVLELVILARMVHNRTFRKYPVFYSYIACVFLVSAGLYVLRVGWPQKTVMYGNWYWRTQLITMLIGYGVILDLSRRALAAYPGAERFVRTIGLGVFVVVFAAVGLHRILDHSWALNLLTAEMERDLRVVEALFLAIILVALSYYRINLGRNLAGLALGMGVYVGVSLITLTLLQFVGTRFMYAWQVLQSGSYLFSLGVWTVAFWSYGPNPSPAGGSLTQGDYEALAGHTREKLEALRSHFTGTARP